MYKINISIFFFFISVFLYSQQKTLLIYDELNKEPIPFAGVKLFKNESFLRGFYSSAEGKVDIKNSNEIDKIEISSTGFEKLNLYLNNKLSDTIFLKKEITQLNEVVLVGSKERDFKEIGYHNTKKEFTYSTTSGMETVVYIENEIGKNYIIKSILSKIIRRKEHTSILKICFYESENDSIFPSDKILGSSEFYYIEGNSKKMYEFDLEYLKIEIPIKGIFVGIEWAGIYDKEKEVFLNDKTFDTMIELNDITNKPYTFTRNKLKNSEWSNLSENLLKYSNIDTENYPNISLGLKVFNLN